MIARTTDGGNSWTQVLDAGPLSGVTFVSPTLAYAVGAGGAVEQSTDGGATWSPRPLVLGGGFATADLDLHEITCADPNTCLISTTDSNELVRTTDGGATGALVSVSNDALASAAFTTGTTVVGVGDQGATVLSSDGGQTFPQVSSGGLATFDPDGPLRAGLAPGTAYLAGSSGQIAQTSDGGRTWSVARVPTDAAIHDVAFASPSVGFALDARGILRRTDDGGTSWRSFPIAHSPRSSLVAPRAGVQLLVGPRGIFRGTDGGADFHRLTGTVTGATLASLRLSHAVVSAGRVLAWGHSGIVVSADAGRTWRRVHAPVAGRELQSVSFAGPARVWAVSNRGRVYETVDGGRHWTPSGSVGGGARPLAVSFSSRLDGLIALGADRSGPLAPASVLSTRDGGLTWEPQVIAGAPGETDAIATSSADYDVGDYGDSANSTSAVHLGFFATDDGGASPLPSSLRISLATRRESAAALAHAGHRVTVTGRLSPVLSANQQVAVTYTDGHGDRRAVSARVSTSGAFRARLTGIHASGSVIAQVLGDGRHGGAGTPVTRFTVTARRSVS